MRIARFPDGTLCRLAHVKGDRFEPHEGDTYLFELPDGSLRQGVISGELSEYSFEFQPIYGGIFDGEARVVMLAR